MHRVETLLASGKPLKWLFYGDSITHGALHTFGARDYTEHFAERIRAELGRTQDIVLNTAISGNTTRDLLRDFDWRLAQFTPHVVFLMIGMNDCSTGREISAKEFRENLQQLCFLMEEDGALPVLQTTCPILPGGVPDRQTNFPIYMNIIREVAAERSLPLVDHEAEWRQQGATKQFYWMNDTFHPNAAGHIAFTHTLLKALNLFDPASVTGRLFVP